MSKQNSQRLHIKQVVWGRERQEGIFLKRTEWQKQPSYSWLTSFHGVLSIAAVCSVRDLGKVGAPPTLYPVSGGNLSSHALSEHHLSSLVIKEMSHSLPCPLVSCTQYCPTSPSCRRPKLNFEWSDCHFEDVVLYIKYNGSLLNDFALDLHDCICFTMSTLTGRL